MSDSTFTTTPVGAIHAALVRTCAWSWRRVVDRNGQSAYVALRFSPKTANEMCTDDQLKKATDDSTIH